MRVEFSFKNERSELFGTVSRPVTRIMLINGDKEVPQLVYIDSGADITLIPKSVGDLLGFRAGSGDKIEEIKGIGEQKIPIIMRL